MLDTLTDRPTFAGQLAQSPTKPAPSGHPHPRATPPRREIELDFLRGLAILLVLDFHAPIHWMSYPFHLLGFPPFGWAGVDIFFILSGFLVGGLLMREWRQTRQIDARRFLIRRGFKIWPQYYVFLAVTVLTRHHSLRSLLGNVLNLQNYMEGGIPHTWSLAVEEHAYLLLTGALVLAARLRLRMRALLALFGAVAVGVPLLRLYLTLHGYVVWDRTHTRIDGIALGVILAVVFHFAPAHFHRAQRLTPAWIALAAAALLFLRFQTTAPWSASVGWTAADLLGVALLMLLYRSTVSTSNAVTLSAAKNPLHTPAVILSAAKDPRISPPPNYNPTINAVILSAAKDPRISPPPTAQDAPRTPPTVQGTRPRSLLYRLVAWIGVYSYGIYLWHVSVIAPITAISTHLPLAMRTLWLALAPILGGIALGALFTALIELPTLRLRDRLFPRRSGPPIPTPHPTPYPNPTEPAPAPI